MRVARSLLAPCSMGLILVAGCSNDVATSGDGSGGSGGGSAASSGSSGGNLPCDVATALEPCAACHSDPPKGGAGITLMTYGDLTATSPKGGTFAERALARMQDANAPMPPAPSAPSTPEAIAAMQAWVDAGLPSGECEPPTDPYATPETCTSAVTWAGEEDPWNGYGRGDMHPGARCIDCHRHPFANGVDEYGPGMWFAGTVYPTAHEPKECIGADGSADGLTVEVIDANGQITTVNVRRSGNFFLEKQPGSGPVAFPIQARVLRGSEVRAMTTAVDSGDCNTCHTSEGTEGAPGRIMAP